jgi:hypothetical protein
MYSAISVGHILLFSLFPVGVREMALDANNLFFFTRAAFMTGRQFSHLNQKVYG